MTYFDLKQYLVNILAARGSNLNALAVHCNGKPGFRPHLKLSAANGKNKQHRSFIEDPNDNLPLDTCYGRLIRGNFSAAALNTVFDQLAALPIQDALNEEEAAKRLKSERETLYQQTYPIFTDAVRKHTKPELLVGEYLKACLQLAGISYTDLAMKFAEKGLHSSKGRPIIYNTVANWTSGNVEIPTWLAEPICEIIRDRLATQKIPTECNFEAKETRLKQLIQAPPQKTVSSIIPRGNVRGERLPTTELPSASKF